LPIWVGSIGTDESIRHTAQLGLPLSFAIIKGDPVDFAPKVQLYKDEWIKAGHSLADIQVGCHVHGFVAPDDQTALDEFYPSTKAFHDVIGPERGRPPFTKTIYDDMTCAKGPLFVGSPETLISRILHLNKTVGITRFMLHMPLGSMPHELIMRGIDLLGNVVKPAIMYQLERKSVSRTKTIL